MTGHDRIDVHAHYFPDAFIEMAARLIDEDRARMTRSRAPGAGFSTGDLVAQLDQAGIDLQVLSPANLLPYVADARNAVTAARETNDIYADLARQRPDRFAVFGSVPLPHVDAAIEETGRCLGIPGVLGIALGCSVAGRPLDDPAFEPFWAELDRRAAVVFLHPVGDTGMALRAYNLNWVVGAPFEDTLAALRLVLSGVTTRYPAIRFIVPHMGGTIPFLLARIDRATGVVARSPDVHLDGPVGDHLRKLHYDTSNRNPHALRCAVETLGAETLVLGSDSPYSLGEELRENVTYIGETVQDADVEAAILGGTAARLLGLPA